MKNRFYEFWKSFYQKKVHPEDRAIMEHFIDWARIKTPMSDSKFRDASRLAEHYGISMDIAPGHVANRFEGLLRKK